MRTPQIRGVLPALISLTLAAAGLPAADWPMYRHDARRSAVAPAAPALPLHAQWRHVPAQPPAPAWPEPVKSLNRLDFDYAPHPVVAENLLCYGSSADDAVHALDAATGRELWSYITGGPVRFAPQLVDKRVFFGSDDGAVYCLDQAQGWLLWRFNAAPAEERFVANGRMISRWPVRTGVLVHEGRVYFAAGMLPPEGVFVYCLDAQTGAVVWVNDTSHALALPSAHGGEYGLLGVAPQGSLLIEGDALLVPTGRNMPAIFDLRTGVLRRYPTGNAFNGRGSSWCTAENGKFYVFGKSFYSDLVVQEYDLLTLNAMRRLKVPQISAFGAGTGRKIQYSVFEPDAKVSAVVSGGSLTARRAFGLALAGEVLFAGEDDAVVAYAQTDGREVWRGRVSGQAREIAVAGSRVFVATDTGEITCFGPEFVAETPVLDQRQRVANRPDPQPEGVSAAALAAVQAAGMDFGYALVLGDQYAKTTEILARHTRLQVINLQRAADMAFMLRQRLAANTLLYGSRIQADSAENPAKLPYARHFANAVVVAGKVEGLDAAELYRVLRPYGGILVCPGLKEPAEAAAFLDAAGAPAAERQTVAGLAAVVRGPLPDAFDSWQSKAQAETLVQWPLRPIWFGEPGPAKVFDRKEFAPSPVAADGLFFIRGENAGEGVLTAVDAYNGFELWSRRVPLNKGMRVDDKCVFVSVGDNKFLAYAARTGEPAGEFDAGKDADQAKLPPALKGKPKGPRTDQKIAGRPRVHPLSGQLGDRIYGGTFGCGGWGETATANIARSGVLAIYDYADDSGMRFIPGLSPSCGPSSLAALGVLFASEGRGGCDCSYNFQASIALAPADRRLHEDWALFHDFPVDTRVRQAHLNLGAPGDRRDAAGDLWLGMPRPGFPIKGPSRTPGGKSINYIAAAGTQALALPVPLELTDADELRTLRVNADRVAIAGTDRPWLYASQYCGLRKAALHLSVREAVAAPPVAEAVKVDGILDDPAWAGRQPAAEIELTKTKVFLCSSPAGLHLATRREAELDNRGKAKPWGKSVVKPGEPVWRDPASELFLTDAAGKLTLHLAVNAAGARWPALRRDGRAGKPGEVGAWESVAKADADGLIVELTVPWQTIEAAGLARDSLRVNVICGNRHNVADGIVKPGWNFFNSRNCLNFVNLHLGEEVPAPAPRLYSVTMHFAELENVAAGGRVFDVSLQGRPVLENFDVAAAAGGPLRAVSRIFADIAAGASLELEFTGRTTGRPPILNALELREQGFTPAKP